MDCYVKRNKFVVLTVSLSRSHCLLLALATTEIIIISMVLPASSELKQHKQNGDKLL